MSLAEAMGRWWCSGGKPGRDELYLSACFHLQCTAHWPGWHHKAKGFCPLSKSAYLQEQDGVIPALGNLKMTSNANFVFHIFLCSKGEKIEGTNCWIEFYIMVDKQRTTVGPMYTPPILKKSLGISSNCRLPPYLPRIPTNGYYSIALT